MPDHVIRVGDVEIMALSDGTLEFDLCNFFPTIPEESWRPHEAHLHDHHVRFNLGSYLIRADGRTILVDTGLGPRPKETPDVPWGTLLKDFQPTRFPNAPTCVWPLADLGLVEFMNGESSLTRALTTVPSPGHTPGHMCILITSRGERALVLGDAAHNPVQIQEPDWVSRADMDPDLTRLTRRALIERLEREQILVAAGHFRAPGFGRIVRLEGRRYWRGL